MNRRNFIRTSGVSLGALLIGNKLMAMKPEGNGFQLKLPDQLYATLNERKRLH
ncbi:MAG: twin-arginine translocation signal domain-containing protein [Bacteroidales bacterium]|nr:twin-arginine translocation signal domain-containing protein [Bacteroidales bacterium]